MLRIELTQTGKVSENALRYSSPAAVAHHFVDLSYKDREYFEVLHVDSKKQMVARETIAIGCLDSAIVHPREVFKGAVHNGSASIVLVHNHPSGDPEPSQDDMSLTTRLRDAGALLGIPVLDHVIIGAGKYYSYVDAHGSMWPSNNGAAAKFHKEQAQEQKQKHETGDKIRKLRIGNGITKQKNFAEQTGIRQAYLSNIEKGYRLPTEEEADKIAAVLKVPTGLFLPAIASVQPESSIGMGEHKINAILGEILDTRDGLGGDIQKRFFNLNNEDQRETISRLISNYDFSNTVATQLLLAAAHLAASKQLAPAAKVIDLGSRRSKAQEGH